MEFFRIQKDIPFMRHALKFNIISLVTFLLAVVFLFSKGLHLSVEFTGGTLIEVNYEQSADLEKIRGSLGKAGFSDYSVQNFGSSQDVMIRLPLKSDQNTNQLGESVMQGAGCRRTRRQSAPRRVCRPAGRQGAC
jgi:preprotein translocase subunit SecF